MWGAGQGIRSQMSISEFRLHSGFASSPRCLARQMRPTGWGYKARPAQMLQEHRLIPDASHWEIRNQTQTQPSIPRGRFHMGAWRLEGPGVTPARGLGTQNQQLQPRGWNKTHLGWHPSSALGCFSPFFLACKIIRSASEEWDVWWVTCTAMVIQSQAHSALRVAAAGMVPALLFRTPVPPQAFPHQASSGSDPRLPQGGAQLTGATKRQVGCSGELRP